MHESSPLNNYRNNQYHKKTFQSITNLKIHHILFLSYIFQTASTTIPILLSPTIAKEYYPNNLSNQSIFVSRIVSNSVLGTAIGKFVNGPICDIFGSRRISIVYSSLWIITVFILSFTYNEKYMLLGCSIMEFFSSVQWPCYVNILARHYYEKDVKMYEHSIYRVSLGSRLGGLICLTGFYLCGGSAGEDWRMTLRKGSCLSSFIATMVMVVWSWDSPMKVHDPVNNISCETSSNRDYMRKMLQDHFLPSFKRIITSGVFWVVSIAHSGSAMIKSSERILGMYYYDTSIKTNGSSEEYSAMVMFLSLGFFFGLAVLGSKFTNANISERKQYILRWYGVTIVCCYALSFLGVYRVRALLWSLISERVVLWLQLLFTFLMGCCIAVQYYTIPAIVATVFGKEKGMYASYTDGVACLVTALVWKCVGSMVQKGNPQLSGWSYGWAFVAIVMIVSALIMMEFLDYYFCFGRGDNAIYSRREEIPQEEQCLLKNVHSQEFTSPVQDLIRRRWKSKPPATVPTKIVQTPEKDYEPLIVLHETPASSTTHQKQYLLQKRLSTLLSQTHNQQCVDCNKPLPRWASIHTKPQTDSLEEQPFGCFICHDCAGIHINLSISHVKSVDFDSHWKEWEVEALERCGNNRINLYYPNFISGDIGMKERKEFIVGKYMHRTGDLLNILEHEYDENRYDNDSDDGSSVLELSLNPSFSQRYDTLEVVHEEDSHRNNIVSPISMDSRHTVVVDLLDDNFDI